MDNFRPTIVVTEMVANRQDIASTYRIMCALKAGEEQLDPLFRYQLPDRAQRKVRHEARGENGRWVGATIVMSFQIGEGNYLEQKN
jgi:hypothetical protein